MLRHPIRELFSYCSRLNLLNGPPNKQAVMQLFHMCNLRILLRFLVITFYITKIYELQFSGAPPKSCFRSYLTHMCIKINLKIKMNLVFLQNQLFSPRRVLMDMHVCMFVDIKHQSP